MISVSSSIGSATRVAGGDISGAVAWVAPGTVVSAHTNGTKAHQPARCLCGLNKVRIDSFMCPASTLPFSPSLPSPQAGALYRYACADCETSLLNRSERQQNHSTARRADQKPSCTAAPLAAGAAAAE